jgi:hypothetical protein
MIGIVARDRNFGPGDRVEEVPAVVSSYFRENLPVPQDTSAESGAV